MSIHVLKPPKLRRYHILESIGSKTFIPREYQVELLDVAKKKNTIICLGTNAGKSFVAVMLIKEFSHQIRPSPSKGGKRTVLLAPSVSVALQQAKVIKDCTDLVIGQYFDNDPQMWSQEKWQAEVEVSQILVMTLDTFEMILHHNFLPLSLFNLIILDECQRALKDTVYNNVMNYFNGRKNQPHILGLSASLIVNRCRPQSFDGLIRELESLLISTVETASDLTTLSKYGSKPKEFIAVYDMYSELDMDSGISSIHEALLFLDSVNVEYSDIFAHPCRQPRRYLIELCYVLVNLGLWCTLKATQLFMEEIDHLLDSMHSRERRCLLVLTRTSLMKVEHEIRRILDGNDQRTNIVDKAPPKLKTLLNLLLPYKPTKTENTSVQNVTKVTVDRVRQKRGQKTAPSPEDSKALYGLVFVHQRIVAYLLSEWLSSVKEHLPEYSFLSPSYIIGKQVNTTKNFQKQEDVLQRFRTKSCNLIVATSAIEEGMDIPKCNLVVRFDPPENFRGYVQSKARARVSDSSYIMMVNGSKKKEFEDTLVDYKALEELLLNRSHEADHTMDEAADEDSVEMQQPYVTANEAATVTLSSAIALVNRYCAKLPSDTFTRLIPKWRIHEENDMFQCILKLPINSPIKKVIEGPFMKNKQLAKMAAALETCIQLHKAGELDDNLLPTGKEAMKAEDLLLDESDEPTPASTQTEEYRRNVARPGTTKRRMYYFKRVADALCDSLPQTGVPSYLYAFDMRLTCPIPEEQNTRGRKIHDPSNTSKKFGILTRKPIPPICSFPVFTRSGEVTISLRPLTSNLFVTEDNLRALEYFHQYTFSEVLRLEKYPMSYKPTESEASFYVVPLISSVQEIDWKFVNLIFDRRDEKPQKLSDEERKNFKFRLDDYQDAVVMPWYRNLDKPQFFYVAEVCSNLSPKSDFPDGEYKSFEEYYTKKYDITIMNPDQPLLDVDHTSARLNLLTPRYVNRKGVTLPTSSEQTKKIKRENLQQKQILIPELCSVHPFPAYLWRKAVCLPCILYRLNSLLLAEQLRLIVANSISVGIRHLPKDFEWPALDFGWSLSDILTCDTVKEEKPDCLNTKNGYVSATHHNEKHLLEYHNSDSPTEGVMDFEIDVFDPSKVYIPDDDALLQQELNELNFVDGPFLNSTFPPLAYNSPEALWQPSPDESGVRCGSPSFFEGSGWDSEWDTHDTNFEMVNLQGLGYISAPGINMKSLSMDLASYRDEEMYDSMDDTSLNSEDEESYDSPSFDKGAPKGEEVCECSWLTCPMYKDELDSPQNDVEDPSGCVGALMDRKRAQLNYLEDNCCMEHPSIFDEMLELAIRSEKSLIRPSNPEQDCTNCLLNGENSSTSSSEQTLAFGELLPNREGRQLFDNMNRVTFDDDLSDNPGPSPSIILQALTMSNANDGINLERLETVGDSFLKYAITVYLFCMYPNIHEGKLSYLRSKQISNFNLFKLGKKKGLGEMMVASKFEPYDNWLPPNFIVPKGLEEALIESGIPSGSWNLSDWKGLTQMSEEEIRQFVVEKSHASAATITDHASSLVPYNLLTQHSIPDKSIADCVEALIGAYLVSCGSRGALLFMSWLGLRVLPVEKGDEVSYGYLKAPPVPDLTREPKSNLKLQKLLAGYSLFEEKIGYCFKDKSCLLQAFTHASYHYNTLTDCYQRLEFLGDAVLDYLITRHLYEDPKKHSPGTLTDLRSALVNNTFFASLAVKYDFHKFFKAISPGLFNVINKFVQLKEHNSRLEDYLQAYYLEEDECEEMEDVEVPKALGDIFESVAGAIYLDSNMSLDTVWRVYYTMMKPEIEYFSSHVPKSPIRELLELEPQTAKFERAEMTVSGKVRVCVDVFGKGQFVGVGRNKRIAKCTAAKHALRELKSKKL